MSNRPAIDHLLQTVKAVSSLWSLTMMASGAPAARGRTADVMHQAIQNMQLAAQAVEAERKE